MLIKIAGLSALTLGMMAGLAAAQVHPPCGSIISGRAFLTQDVSCPDNSPTFILEGGTLNMLRHTVDCGGNAGIGIDLRGRGARLLNGTIIGGCAEGVRLLGDGEHTVFRVNSSGNRDDGFDVRTDSNTLSFVTANNNSGSGIDIGDEDTDSTGNQVFAATANRNGECGIRVGLAAAANRIRRNNLNENDDVGICDFGTGSVVIRNRAYRNGLFGFRYGGPIGPSFGGTDGDYRKNRAADNARDGFLISGTSGSFVRNHATANGHNGFGVTGGANDNVLDANSAFGNGDAETTFDIWDEDGDCADNTYAANRFATANADCVR